MRERASTSSAGKPWIFAGQRACGPPRGRPSPGSKKPPLITASGGVPLFDRCSTICPSCRCSTNVGRRFSARLTSLQVEAQEPGAGGEAWRLGKPAQQPARPGPH